MKKFSETYGLQEELEKYGEAQKRLAIDNKMGEHLVNELTDRIISFLREKDTSLVALDMAVEKVKKIYYETARI